MILNCFLNFSLEVFFREEEREDVYEKVWSWVKIGPLFPG